MVLGCGKFKTLALSLSFDLEDGGSDRSKPSEHLLELVSVQGLDVDDSESPPLTNVGHAFLIIMSCKRLGSLRNEERN